MARAAPVLVLLAVFAASAEGDYSADAYAACSACHLPDGAGVPGAFPPIRNRAAAMARLDGGREYMIAVVTYGLMGTIQVDSAQYFGVMAGLGASMSDDEIAAALNYIVFALSDDEVTDVEPFTAAEVGQVRAAMVTKSPAGGGQMRTELAEKHGGRLP